jgi:hypothetical protein
MDGGVCEGGGGWCTLCSGGDVTYYMGVVDGVEIHVLSCYGGKKKR